MRTRSVSASSMFGVVNPDRGLHPVDAHEHDVEMDAPQGRHGERADERVARGADAAGQDDRLVVAGRRVERVRDRDRVGHDGQAGDVDEGPGEGVGRRPGRQPDGHARLDEADGGRGDRLLLVLLEGRLGREPGLEQRRCPAERGRAAVDLLDESLLVERPRGRAGRSCRTRRAGARDPRPGPLRRRGSVRGSGPGAAGPAPSRVLAGNDPRSGQCCASQRASSVLCEIDEQPARKSTFSHIVSTKSSAQLP